MTFSTSISFTSSPYHFDSKKKPQEFSSERLLFRQPEINDRSEIFRIYSDEKTSSLSPIAAITNEAETQHICLSWIANWKKFGLGPWVISDHNHNDGIIGFGGVSMKDFDGKLRPNF